MCVVSSAANPQARPPTFLSIYLATRISICLSGLSAFLFSCLSAYLPICLSFYLPMCARARARTTRMSVCVCSWLCAPALACARVRGCCALGVYTCERLGGRKTVTDQQQRHQTFGNSAAFFSELSGSHSQRLARAVTVRTNAAARSRARGRGTCAVGFLARDYPQRIDDPCSARLAIDAEPKSDP